MNSKSAAIKACMEHSKQDSRYAPPTDADVIVTGPMASKWTSGIPHDGFNQIGDRIWHVYYTRPSIGTTTLIWINAENGNLRIMSPHYKDGGLFIQNQKAQQ